MRFPQESLAGCASHPAVATGKPQLELLSACFAAVRRGVDTLGVPPAAPTWWLTGADPLAAMMEQQAALRAQIARWACLLVGCPWQPRVLAVASRGGWSGDPPRRQASLAQPAQVAAPERSMQLAFAVPCSVDTPVLLAPTQACF